MRPLHGCFSRIDVLINNAAAVSSPDLDGVSGRFFLRCRETHTKQITYDNSVAVRLWNMSQALYESRASAGSRTE